MTAPSIPKLLEILVCPLTKGPLEFDATRQELISRSAKLAYPIRDGIPIMLPEEARKIDVAHARCRTILRCARDTWPVAAIAASASAEETKIRVGAIDAVLTVPPDVERPPVALLIAGSGTDRP